MKHSKLKSSFNVSHKKSSQHASDVQVSIKLKLCADQKLKIMKRLLQTIFSKQLLKFILKYIILQRIPSCLVHQLVVASTIISFSVHSINFNTPSDLRPNSITVTIPIKCTTFIQNQQELLSAAKI
ncbi:Hypothetical_protein [Hexamita inflata]|uniref:Hypothetical_protein n=1 Tax=Hexamita inflata TaxID=28002 RepID=A0AA86NEQ4_9EUKA|nr:Hypothetical protein HINF_LOCUS5815 [Hexamita inflata]